MLHEISSFRVFVNDFHKCVGFYEHKLGLRLEFSSNDHAEFQTSGPKLILEKIDRDNVSESEMYVGRFIGLSFRVKEMNRTYQRLTALGIEFTGPPQTTPWGGMVTHFYDPDTF